MTLENVLGFLSTTTMIIELILIVVAVSNWAINWYKNKKYNQFIKWCSQ